MKQIDSNAFRIQNGTFATIEVDFALKFFQIFHFHTGEPILFTLKG